jgi:hemoglobin
MVNEAQVRPAYRRIDVSQACQLLKAAETLILDVRDANSFAAGHIHKSRNVTSANVGELVSQIRKDTPVLIYCYHGVSSQTYAQIFIDFGFREVYSLDGGYEAWRAVESDAPQKSHFDLVGGQPAVDQIIDAFYRRMDTLPEARTIRALHPPDLSETRIVLKKYLAEWLGGPQLYSQERGHPRLRMRHLPFPIGAPERDAWILCMSGALEEVVASEELRTVLLKQLFKTADWMRNSDR